MALNVEHAENFDQLWAMISEHSILISVSTVGSTVYATLTSFDGDEEIGHTGTTPFAALMLAACVAEENGWMLRG